MIPRGRAHQKKLKECDVIAATILENRNTGVDDNRLRMWVGSVDGNNVIASYSIEAGKMANGFLTAHDDLLSSGDGEGTSYAAPRVSGAGTDYQATSTKWSGIFTASNNTVYDTSQLNEAENTQFFFKAYYKTFLYNNRILNRIPFAYDNGYESALFSTDPSLSFGVDLNYRLNSALLVSTSILDFARIEGSILERPCRDSFLRQFHCGIGLAWTDSKDSHITNTAPPNLSYR